MWKQSNKYIPTVCTRFFIKKAICKIIVYIFAAKVSQNYQKLEFIYARTEIVKKDTYKGMVWEVEGD